MSSKSWLLAAFAVIAFIVFSSLLVASSTFTYTHPRAPGMYFEVGSNGAPQLKMQPDLQDALEIVKQQHPFAVVKENRHSFGEMNLQAEGKHEFEIRNEGQGPLTLRDGGSTCKCTAAEIETPVIPPGESGKVIVRWSTGSKTDLTYAQRVILKTNDPAKPEIPLIVAGRVADVCAVEPEAALFPSLMPDQSGRAELLVHSKEWENFEITHVENGLPFLSWESRPATEDELAKVFARSGRRLTLNIAEDVAAGEFNHVLKVTVQPSRPESQPLVLDIEVAGHKLGRVSIVGPQIKNSGIVELGAVTQGEAKSCRLLLRYRGQSAAEIPLRIEAEPAYLKGHITPRSSKNGLFDLEVSVVEDAPLCNHLGVNPAKLRLISEQPDQPPVELLVEFAVIRP